MDVKKRIIFHVDVNSAFLSWSAVHALKNGDKLDIRKIPSVIGGDSNARKGIVLAKSMPAKKYNIKTGEPLFRALQKCKNLKIFPPEFDVYVKSSIEMMKILSEYTPLIEKFSIDECFLDMTYYKDILKDTLKIANDIRERIKNELGFTVNIGIAHNKLLAKMASDFQKPDRVHTLFENEIERKMWPLKVEELFMVGRATAPKLHKLNMNTIGDIARSNPVVLKSVLKSHGNLIWNYANGIDDSKVKSSNHIEMKGIGNSTTVPFDIGDRKTAHIVILSLCETVGMRLRNSNNMCKIVCVEIKSSDFVSYSRQKKLSFSTDSTKEIEKSAYKLFDAAWKGEKIRLLGVSVSGLSSNEIYQMSIFDSDDRLKNKSLDDTIDKIRNKYGSSSIIRGVFLKSTIDSAIGRKNTGKYNLHIGNLDKK
ncbi:MAG: DNA polymerase IV [Clostridium sp.]|nr:DNA polymerase IV [Clostridium sp.]